MRLRTALLIALSTTPLVAAWLLHARDFEPTPPANERSIEVDRPVLIHRPPPFRFEAERFPFGRERVHQSRHATFPVHGQVVDAKGNALPRATVRAVHPNRNDESITVDEAGWFTYQVAMRPVARLGVTAPGHVPHLSGWIVPKEGLARLGPIFLKRAVSISGHVAWEDGSPNKDIRVFAEPVRDDNMDSFRVGGWDNERQVTKTDAAGDFHFDQLPDGTYNIVAGTRWQERIIEGVVAGRTDLRFRLPVPQKGIPRSEWPFSVSGEVTTEDGGPLPTCAVILRHSNSRTEMQLTWKDGRFEAPLPIDAHYTLHVTPNGSTYAPWKMAFTPKDKPIKIVLRKGHTIAGTISHGGNGLAEDTVYATGWIQDDGSVSATQTVDSQYLAWHATTDTDGRFVLSGLLPGTVRLSTSSKPLLQQEKDLFARVGATDVRITLSRRATITVRVITKDEHDPHDVTVRFRQHTRRKLRWVQGRAIEQSHGTEPSTETIHKYAMQSRDSRYEIRVQARGTWGWASTKTEPLLPSDDVIVVRLRTRDPLRVQVVDEAGTPVPGAQVALLRPATHPSRRADTWPSRSAHGFTDLQGVFDTKPFALGPWRVRVHARGKSQRGLLPLVGDADKEVKITLHPALSIRGRIQNQTHPMQVHGELIAWPLDGQQEFAAWGRADSGGRFQLDGLSPGRYQFTHEAGPTYPSDPPLLYVASDPIEAGAHDVVLTLKQGLVSSLHLYDAKGTRVTNVEVWATGSFGVWDAWAPPGKPYRITTLPPGQFSFYVRDRDSIYMVPFQAGQDAMLQLPR